MKNLIETPICLSWFDSSQEELRIGRLWGENFIISAIKRKRIQIQKHVSGVQVNVLCFRKLILISDLTTKQVILQPHTKGSLTSNSTSTLILSTLYNIRSSKVAGISWTQLTRVGHGNSVFWPKVIRKLQIHGKTDKRISEQSFQTVHLFMENIMIMQYPFHKRISLRDSNSFNKFTALLLDKALC